VPELSTPSTEDVRSVRRSLGLNAEQRYLIYPGDLETSSGADATAALAERVPAVLPDLLTVFAYRRKTARAAEVAERLSARLPGASTRFVQNAPNILALLAGAAAVVFPVDDLWGKVDLPIVLLEAMALGVPVVVLDQGPLCDLGGVVKVPNLGADRWLRDVSRTLKSACHVRTARAAGARLGGKHTDLVLLDPSQKRGKGLEALRSEAKGAQVPVIELPSQMAATRLARTLAHLAV